MHFEPTDQLKRCNKCDQEKPITEYHTRKKHRTRGGTAYVYVWLSSTCKECEHALRADYARTDAGKASSRRSFQKRWEDPEQRAKILEYQKSEHGKAVRQRYQRSERGKATREAYMSSEEGHALALKRWGRHRENRKEAVEATQGRKFSSRHWRLILRAYESHCAYCDATDLKLSPDHVVPLAKGGEHKKENIVPACLACNETKKDQLGWVPRAPRLPLAF